MATVRQTDALPPRRSAASEIAAAIDLGWRVAVLHALRPATLASPPAQGDVVLLNRVSLGAVDRLELELHAIASVAPRAGVALTDQDLKRLFDLISDAAASQDGEKRFRCELARTHIKLAKRLWAQEEARGRAYELGNFLSDTWNRVLEPRATQDSHSELLVLFRCERVDRIKVLLDNLQTRLDPAAVHVVEEHLDAWRERIAKQPASHDGGVTALTRDQVAKKYEAVERQTIIWRQMLTGDKEPEAYIGHAKRGQVRDELTRQLRRRYLRLWWVAPILVALAVLVWYVNKQDPSAAASVVGTLTAIGGIVGITRVSMIATVKRGLQDWGELIWNRSLATVICQETLVMDDDLLPPPAEHGLSPRGLKARCAGLKKRHSRAAAESPLTTTYECGGS